jgi:hypothetical protein
LLLAYGVIQIKKTTSKCLANIPISKNLPA